MIITLLRKPLDGTVAENTLKHGCGAINIDATMVSFEEKENVNFEARQRQQTASYKESGWSGHVAQVGSDIQMYKEKGRWPANFILTHKEGCELIGTKKVKSGTAILDNKTKIKRVAYGDFDPVGIAGYAGYADKDGKETISDWACVEGCPVQELDSGGASRFFKQFKKDNDQ